MANVRPGPDGGWYDQWGHWWPSKNQAENAKPPNTQGPPKKQPPYGGTSPKGAYDLTGFSAGAAAEALQEATDFASWLGYPSWFNIDAMQKDLLQIGVQGDANQAYQFLWTQLKPDQQKDNINAYFGFTKQQYTEKLNTLNDMYQLYTGDTNVPDALRNKALSQNWTQTELLTALQADPTIGGTSPWLATGQTFRDVSAQFVSQYGVQAKDKATLGSWWKFRSGAQAVGTGGVAQQTFMPPQPLITRPLSSDVETR